MRLLILATMLIVAAPPVSGQTVARPIDSLRSVLANLDRNKSFHGVVLVADRGKIVHHSAHGLAHKGYQIPNRLDTKFNLASVGKTWTAVAIGQLVAAGKLRFADTLSRVLPDYPNQAVASRITIAQLLSHRSGMGLYWDALLGGNWPAVRTTADLLPYFVNDTLLFAPGSQWFYSNSGFAVLAMVVEKVSGEDYFGYIQRHILDAAGMTQSGFFELDRDVPNIAIGYYRDEAGTVKNNLFTHTVRGGGAGGGWSTAPDMLKWAEALRTSRVLPDSIWKVMSTKQTDSDRSGLGGFGYGFMVQVVNGRRLVGHTGGFEGITTFFFFDPERDRVGVMMVNDDGGGPSFRQVWAAVQQVLTAE